MWDAVRNIFRHDDAREEEQAQRQASGEQAAPPPGGPAQAGQGAGPATPVASSGAPGEESPASSPQGQAEVSPPGHAPQGLAAEPLSPSPAAPVAQDAPASQPAPTPATPIDEMSTPAMLAPSTPIELEGPGAAGARIPEGEMNGQVTGRTDTTTGAATPSTAAGLPPVPAASSDERAVEATLQSLPEEARLQVPEDALEATTASATPLEAPSDELAATSSSAAAALEGQNLVAEDTQGIEGTRELGAGPEQAAPSAPSAPAESGVTPAQEAPPATEQPVEPAPRQQATASTATPDTTMQPADTGNATGATLSDVDSASGDIAASEPGASSAPPSSQASETAATATPSETAATETQSDAAAAPIPAEAEEERAITAATPETPATTEPIATDAEATVVEPADTEAVPEEPAETAPEPEAPPALPAEPVVAGTVIGDRYTIVGPAPDATAFAAAEQPARAYQATDARSYERCWSCGSTDNGAGTRFCQNCGAAVQNHPVTLVETPAATGIPGEVAHEGSFFHVQPERRPFGPSGIGVEIGAYSAEGPHHPNEDSYWYVVQTVCANSGRQSTAVAAFADGMGGYAPGSGLISAHIVATVGSHVANALGTQAGQDGSVDDQAMEAILREGIGAANKMVLDEIARTGEMGATLVVAVVHGDRAYLANVGDSRAYYVDPRGQATAITHDQSLVAQEVAAGQIGEHDVYTARGNNIILHAIGEPDVEQVADCYTQQLEPGSLLMLCSDGYWKTMRGEVTSGGVLQGSTTLGKAAQDMVDRALAAGSDDNTTVVLIAVS